MLVRGAAARASCPPPLPPLLLPLPWYLIHSCSLPSVIYEPINVMGDLQKRSKSEISNCSAQLLDPHPRFTKHCVDSFLKKKTNHVFINLVQFRFFYGVIRIEETKLVSAISRKLIFDCKTVFFA